MRTAGADEPTDSLRALLKSFCGLRRGARWLFPRIMRIDLRRHRTLRGSKLWEGRYVLTANVVFCPSPSCRCLNPRLSVSFAGARSAYFLPRTMRMSADNQRRAAHSFVLVRVHSWFTRLEDWKLWQGLYAPTLRRDSRELGWRRFFPRTFFARHASGCESHREFIRSSHSQRLRPFFAACE